LDQIGRHPSDMDVSILDKVRCDQGSRQLKIRSHPVTYGPAGTIIEGRRDQLMNVTRTYRAAMRQKTERVITFIKIDDYADHAGRLTGGHCLHRGKTQQTYEEVTSPVIVVMRQLGTPRKRL
jgi:hypothetical protein